MWGWSHPITSPRRDERYPYGDIHHGIGPSETNKGREKLGHLEAAVIDDVLRSMWPANHSSIRPTLSRNDPMWVKKRSCQGVMVWSGCVYSLVWTFSKYNLCHHPTGRLISAGIYRNTIYMVDQQGKGRNTFTCIHTAVCFLLFVRHVTHRMSVIFLCCHLPV